MQQYSYFSTHSRRPTLRPRVLVHVKLLQQQNFSVYIKNLEIFPLLSGHKSPQIERRAWWCNLGVLLCVTTTRSKEPFVPSLLVARHISSSTRLPRLRGMYIILPQPLPRSAWGASSSFFSLAPPASSDMIVSFEVVLSASSSSLWASSVSNWLSDNK